MTTLRKRAKRARFDLLAKLHSVSEANMTWFDPDARAAGYNCAKQAANDCGAWTGTVGEFCDMLEQ